MKYPYLIIFCIVLSAGLAKLEAADGAGIFAEKCAVCHLANGQGVPGIYPPLADTLGSYLKVEKGRAYLVHSLAYGLLGPITVKDQPYSGVMPPFSQLENQEIADVINYVLSEFNRSLLPEDFQRITTEEVKKYRAENLAPTDVYKEREAVIEMVKRAAAAKAYVVPEINGEAELYARQCQGCHLADGKGLPDTVPPLLNFVGYFAHIPEGRAYLVRVPGVAHAPLRDGDIAALLNWMLITFSRDQLPMGFKPLTAEEVHRYRADKLLAVSRERRLLIEKLQAARILR